VLQNGVRGREAGDRHTEGRAAHIVQAGDVAELDRAGLAAVLAADTDFQLRPRLASLAHSHLDELADALPVQHMEGVFGKDFVLDVEEEKVALLRYRIQNDAVSLLDATIIYNQPPNYFLRHGKFTMSGISTSGVELFSFALADPREIDMPPQEEFTPSIGPLTDTSFSAVVPLESAMRTVQIRNAETGEVIHIADLADAILEFCEGIGYEDVQCQNSDLDTDAIPDTDDNCPLVSNEDQTDGDGDGAGDACDNCPEVYNPDQADSDGNGTGDACENGGDADRDGIPDADDLCPASDIRSSVMVGLCDTKVDNSLVENGCTMNDLITQCAENSKNHGKFVSCISHIINEWKKAGLISKQEKGTIQNCAAKAKVP